MEELSAPASHNFAVRPMFHFIFLLAAELANIQKLESFRGACCVVQVEVVCEHNPWTAKLVDDGNVVVKPVV